MKRLLIFSLLLLCSLYVQAQSYVSAGVAVEIIQNQKTSDFEQLSGLDENSQEYVQIDFIVEAFDLFLSQIEGHGFVDLAIRDTVVEIRPGNTVDDFHNNTLTGTDVRNLKDRLIQLLKE